MKSLIRIGPSNLIGFLLGIALLGTLAKPAVGQIVQIDELRPLRPDATVELEVVVQSVIVEGWDRNEIQIVGEYDSDIEEIDIRETDGSFRFEIEQTSGSRRGDRRDPQRLEVRVPRGIRLFIETVSGSLDVSGVNGALDAEAVSGSARARGDLTSASLSSISGSVEYDGDSPSVRLESVSGGVTYAGTSRDVQLESVSGSVRIEGGVETIEAGSVSGSIRISTEIPVQSLDVNSVSGQVDFRGNLAPGGRIDVDNHSGTVELSLGSNTDARFRVTSLSGEVSSNLPGMLDEVHTRGRFTPNRSLEFTTGSGSGRVTVASFSGDVRITE